MKNRISGTNATVGAPTVSYGTALKVDAITNNAMPTTSVSIPTKNSSTVVGFLALATDTLPISGKSTITLFASGLEPDSKGQIVSGPFNVSDYIVDTTGQFSLTLIYDCQKNTTLCKAIDWAVKHNRNYIELVALSYKETKTNSVWLYF